MPAIDDLVAFMQRDDIQALAQAAIAHAQFETIHPLRRNGCSGRAVRAVVSRHEESQSRLSGLRQAEQFFPARVVAAVGELLLGFTKLPLKAINNDVGTRQAAAKPLQVVTSPAKYVAPSRRRAEANQRAARGVWS